MQVLHEFQVQSCCFSVLLSLQADILAHNSTGRSQDCAHGAVYTNFTCSQQADI